MFRILYIFIDSDPPSWVGYAHAAVLIGLMGLAYIQSSRRGVGFMIVFVALAGIFMVDVLAYVPFYIYIRARDRGRVQPRQQRTGSPSAAGTSAGKAKKAPRGGRTARAKRRSR